MKRVLIALFVLLASCSVFAKKHEDAGPCTKNVSFSGVMKFDGKIHPFMADWVANTTKKFAKDHPDVCFSQEPQAWAANYMVIFSASAATSRGVQLVNQTSTSTSTSTGTVSGNGTVSGSGGSWNYTYDGTVNGTATTTTTTPVNVPYDIQTNVLYATAYNANGGIVGQRNHVYETQNGGNSSQAFGRNLGSALRAINARGRMLTGVFEDIQRSPIVQSAAQPQPVPMAQTETPAAVPEVSLADQAKSAQQYADCLKVAVDNPSVTCK